MSDQNSDLDALLRHHAEQQMKDFDWNSLSARISARLGRATSPDTFRHRALLLRMASAAVVAAAVVLLTVLLYWWVSPDGSPSILAQISAGRLDAGPLGPARDKIDNLIADTNPRTILLTEQTHLICSDPLLRPHSIWEQEPIFASADARIKEKWQ